MPSIREQARITAQAEMRKRISAFCDFGVTTGSL